MNMDIVYIVYFIRNGTHTNYQVCKSQHVAEALVKELNNDEASRLASVRKYWDYVPISMDFS